MSEKQKGGKRKKKKTALFEHLPADGEAPGAEERGEERVAESFPASDEPRHLQNEGEFYTREPHFILIGGVYF